MRPPPRIALHRATPADSAYADATKKAAFGLYVERQFGQWDEAQQRVLHDQRFAAQDFYIIQHAKRRAGIVAVRFAPQVLHVNQVMIEPCYQGLGIGAAVMALLMDQACGAGQCVHLQVLKVNPRAKAFYARLGFEVCADTATHWQMAFSP